MSNLRQAAQQALEFCEFLWRDVMMNDYSFERLEQNITSLRAALAEPQTTHWEGCEAVHPECRAKTELERKSDAIQRLWKERDELRALNAELVEALRSTGLLLHHVWCDVQMNDYSFEKLNQQMQVVDAALAKAQGESK